MTRLPLLLAATLLVAASAAQPPPAPLRIIQTISPQGVQEVTPGAIVSTAALGRPDSAILAANIVLDWKGEHRSIARGDASGPTGTPGEPAEIFCEPEHEGSIGKVLTGQLAFGLVGALRPTHVNTRYCLFDADHDAKFDHAFLVGAKGEGRAPFAIPPAEYGLIEGQRLGDDTVLRLRYVGPAESSDTIAFDLEAYGFGRLREVPHARHYVPVSKLPNYAVIGQAVVTVLTYDPKSRVATIRMEHDLAPGHIVLPELSRGS